MKYALYEGDSKSAADIVSVDFDDKFSAEAWARDWVNTNGKGDTYTLASADGGFALSLFRTQQGQWYFTPKTG